MDRRILLLESLTTVLGIGVGKGLRSRRKNLCKCGTPGAPEAGLLFPNKWGKTHLRWFMGSRDSDLSRCTWDAIFERAFASWAAITPLTFEKVNRYDACDLAIGVSSRRRSGFGKTGGVLAWAQLPVGRDFDGRLMSMFDTAELWLEHPAETGVLLQSVAAHEIGHLLGLGHSSDKTSLMYPFLSSVRRPQDDDIAKIQRLYSIKEGDPSTKRP